MNFTELMNFNVLILVAHAKAACFLCSCAVCLSGVTSVRIVVRDWFVLEIAKAPDIQRHYD